MLIFCGFVQVFVFTTNHHLKVPKVGIAMSVISFSIKFFLYNTYLALKEINTSFNFKLT